MPSPGGGRYGGRTGRGAGGGRNGRGGRERGVGESVEEREKREERERVGGERWRKKPRSAPGDLGGRNSVLFAAFFARWNAFILFYFYFIKRMFALFF